MKKLLFIIGGKSTGIEIREVVDQFYNEVFDEVFNVIGESELSCNYSFIRDNEMLSYFDRNDTELYYIISISNHKIRKKFINEFAYKKIKPFNVIHPKSMISKSAVLGKGIYIAHGAVISSFAKVEDHCMINYEGLIGHDSVVEENCILNPGCKISGNVVIGNNTLIGSNSFIKQGLIVGENVLVDAMCYIERNIGPNKMYKSKIELKEFKNIFK